jgi:hypothetical protein
MRKPRHRGDARAGVFVGILGVLGFYLVFAFQIDVLEHRSTVKCPPQLGPVTPTTFAVKKPRSHPSPTPKRGHDSPAQGECSLLEGDGSGP